MDIHSASQYGSHYQLEVLVRQGNNINDLTYLGWSPLHYTVAYNRMENAKWLLNNDADPDAGSDHYYGITPLFVAASMGKMDYIQLLIDHGADINFKNTEGKTALINAIMGNHVEIVKYLISLRASVDDALYYLIKNKLKYKYVKMFIKTIPDPSFFMFAAVHFGNVLAVKLFLDIGTDVDTSFEGESMIRWALHYVNIRSIHDGHEYIVRLLVNHGAKTKDLKRIFKFFMFRDIFSHIIARPNFPIEYWEHVPVCSDLSDIFHTVVSRNKKEAKLLVDRLPKNKQDVIRTAFLSLNKTIIPNELHDDIIKNVFIS